jgi:4-hydroxyphenylpyruvate dioxygenase
METVPATSPLEAGHKKQQAKADQIKVKSNPNLSKGNPMTVRGIDHIAFWVDDAEQWAAWHENVMGMRRRAVGDPSTGLEGRKAIVVGQGRINFVFVEPAGKGAIHDEVARHIETHGNGVKDLAFRVRDVDAAIRHAKRVGATVLKEPSVVDGYHHAQIAAYSDTVHSLVMRDNHQQFAPGFRAVPAGVEDDVVELAMIDHVVANVNSMNEWVNFYAKIFGFDEVRHFDINTGRSALMSKVVGDEDGYIKLPINEPSSENSQIQEFINEYRGQGVQHIALLTPDIITTVGALRQRGMKFLEVPDTYYEEMPGRVGEIKEDLQKLKERRILVDRDRPDGYLLQLFAHPLFDRPTMFYEIIQRRGNSDGFGEGNFRALFEAIEREQAKRGTL